MLWLTFFVGLLLLHFSKQKQGIWSTHAQDEKYTFRSRQSAHGPQVWPFRERGWQPKSIADNLGDGISMKSCGIYSHPHPQACCAWIYKSRAVNLIWTWMSLVLHVSDFLNSRESYCRLGPICWDLIIGHKILILEQPPITTQGKNCFKLSSCAQSMPGSSSSLSSCLHRAWDERGVDG